MERKPQRKFSREFKLEAVRQAATSGKAKAQVARDLGVRVGQLRTWRLEFENEGMAGLPRPEANSSDDLEHLRRENLRLKVENEILKKASILFARASG
jgi:transposase